MRMSSGSQEPLNACQSSGRGWASLAPPTWCESVFYILQDLLDLLGLYVYLV